MGLRAKTVLDFAELWDFLETQTRDALLNSAHGEAELREREYQRYWCIKDMQSILKGMWGHAQAIQKQDTLTQE